MHTSHQKPSMTADPLLLTPKAKPLAADSDELQGMPISMLCCGDGRCGDRGCEGHPDNRIDSDDHSCVDHALRRKVVIAFLAWALVVVLVGIAGLGYMVGKLNLGA